MTDRHAAYIVILEDDIREDDAEPVLTALRMIHGVASVEPVVSGYPFAVARSRRDDLWRNALSKLVVEGPGETS